MTTFRTIHKNGRIYKIPIRNRENNDKWIQGSLNKNHKGAAKEYLKRIYGKEAFTERGTIKPEYLNKGIKHAKANGDTLAEKRLVEAKTLSKIRGAKGMAHRRNVDRMNALKGTEKWKEMSPRQREGKRMRPSHGWGFNGESPETEARKYKTKRNKGEPPLNK